MKSLKEFIITEKYSEDFKKYDLSADEFIKTVTSKDKTSIKDGCYVLRIKGDKNIWDKFFKEKMEDSKSEVTFHPDQVMNEYVEYLSEINPFLLVSKEGDKVKFGITYPLRDLQLFRSSTYGVWDYVNLSYAKSFRYESQVVYEATAFPVYTKRAYDKLTHTAGKLDNYYFDKQDINKIYSTFINYFKDIKNELSDSTEYSKDDISKLSYVCIAALDHIGDSTGSANDGVALYDASKKELNLLGTYYNGKIKMNNISKPNDIINIASKIMRPFALYPKVYSIDKKTYDYILNDYDDLIDGYNDWVKNHITKLNKKFLEQ